MERYARHNLIDWFSQEELSNLRVVVIGAGAVGNEVTKNLALLGVGWIDIYDFDRIEEHNLTRSVLFRDEDVGCWKSEIAAERARDLDPNIRVNGHVGDFWDLLSLAKLIKSDLLFCCVDNFEARIRCNTLCLLSQTDFVNLGIDSRFAVVEIFPFSSDCTVCYECGLPETVYQRMAERYSCGHLRKVSFVERKIPTTIVTSSASGAIGVSLGLRLGSAVTPAATRTLIDTTLGTSTRTELVKNSICPACSRLPDQVTILPAGRRIDEPFPDVDPASITITLSEPVLTAYRIGDDCQLVFRRAAEFDDTFASQVSDTPDAVDIETRDQFTLDEIVDQFKGKNIPTKFAIVGMSDKSFVLEFEGEDNV